MTRAVIIGRARRTAAVLAFGLARSRLGGRLVGAVSRWTPRLMPGLVARRPALVVVQHPRPISPTHLVAVPRRYARDVESEAGADPVFWDELAAWLPDDLGDRTRLITNVGRRQDVRFLHVHVTDVEAEDRPAPSVRSPTLSSAVRQLRTDGDDRGASYVFRQAFRRVAGFLRRRLTPRAVAMIGSGQIWLGAGSLSSPSSRSRSRRSVCRRHCGN